MIAPVDTQSAGQELSFSASGKQPVMFGVTDTSDAEESIVSRI